MPASLFGSDLWKPALDKFTDATGLAVELFGFDGQMILASTNPNPLLTLLRDFGCEPGLYAESARRCLKQTVSRPAILVDERVGLAVIGTSLALDGRIVGAAVAGYALVRFPNVDQVQRWARTENLPFTRLWGIVRGHSPAPERRLLLHGELLKVLGDALLRENLRTRQYEEAVAKLEAASSAKDDFLAVLSHELRTPLAPILNWASVLKANESPQVRQAGEAIARNVAIESRLIEDLLDLNQVTRGALPLDVGVHDVRALIRAAIDTSAHIVEQKTIRLELAQGEEPLLVEGDAVRLQQIFGNVVSNAVKFTPDGGRIGIAIDRVEDRARVIVADSGVGIAPEFLPHVFDVFRRQEQGGRQRFSGLGIGLSLVKQFIELHRGTVSVASGGLGKGAEVRIELPLARVSSQPDAAAAGDEALPAEALAGLSILVVEDMPDSREALSALLQQAGAEVLVAGTGGEGLEMVRAAKVDLVLCDLQMPQMDGFEFIDELHRRPSSARLPVVAVSALVGDADHRRTREAGFEGHIDKPFDRAAVIYAARAALRPGAAASRA